MLNKLYLKLLGRMRLISGLFKSMSEIESKVE